MMNINKFRIENEYLKRILQKQKETLPLWKEFYEADIPIPSSECPQNTH